MTIRLVVSLMLAVLGCSLVLAADDTPWTWAGVEILGNHAVPRSAIEVLIPIPMGGVYHVGDAPFWKDACAEVQRKFDFAAVVCGDVPVRVFDGRKAFLIVDVVEKGREGVMKFRDPPLGSVAFANDEMVRVNVELDSKVRAASMAGNFYNESGQKGYLSYEDVTGKNEDLSPLVDRLVQLVPQYRDNLFDVLRHEKDAKRRQRAAELLNWSGGDMRRTLRRALALLDDPDGGVRNNLSRFMIQFVGTVKSKRLRHQLIDAFVDQVGRPSHGDRNKGLYNLFEIARTVPDDRDYIGSRGSESIRYLAENSVLFNVQGPAKDLLALLDPTAQPEVVGSP